VPISDGRAPLSYVREHRTYPWKPCYNVPCDMPGSCKSLVCSLYMCFVYAHWDVCQPCPKKQGIEKQPSRDKFSVWMCHTVAREQHGAKRRFKQFEHLPFYCTPVSCSTNTERASLLYSNFSVSGMGFLYLAMNHQGAIVYNLPYMLPVNYRIIFQLAFGVGVH
jgi:hypothetical protein